MADNDIALDLEQMDMMAGDYDPDFQEIYVDFVSGFPALLGKLNAAIASGDTDETQKAAHQIKGSAANFGFVATSSAAAQIELRAKAKSLDGASELSDKVASGFEAAQRELLAQRGFPK